MTSVMVANHFRHKLHLNLMPLSHGSGKGTKIPWQVYQTEKCNLPIEENQNFAIICGITSDNLVCLDYDHIDELTDDLTPFPNILDKTLVVKTGNGFHVLIRTDKTLKKIIMKKNDKVLEILGQGQYFLGATSKHYEKDESGNYIASGKTYDIISNADSIMQVDSLELWNRLTDKGWINTSATSGIKQELHLEDYNSQNKIAELEKGNWSSGERYTNGFSYTVKRLTRGDSIEEIRESLIQINSTCHPPHSQTEIDRIIKDGMNQHLKNIKNKPNEESRHQSPPELGHNEIANMIMDEKSFVTVDKAYEILTFDGRRYSESHAQSIIKKRVDEILPNATTSFRSEVIEKIRIRTNNSIDGFDTEPELITLENGNLNLKSLELTPHDPSVLNTILIPNEYHLPKYPINVDSIFADIEKNLRDTLFWKFLSTSFTVDGELDSKSLETALEVIALCFIKSNVDNYAIMNLGAGENGKSKFLEYLELLIGKENSHHATLQQLGADKFQSAELKNKMINTFPDLEDDELRGTGLIKTIITSESITAQKKYGHPFTFKPFCKLLFSCNRFPKVRDQSQGFFRRWIILKWKRNFANDPERDEHLLEKLSENKEERNLVFSSLIHLSNKILESGWTHKPDWKLIQKEWNENADPVSYFVDNFTTDSDTNIPIRIMWQKYKAVCYDKGDKPLGIGQFSKEFEQFYDKDKLHGVRLWLNVAIKEPIQTELLENMQ